ncbi:MAG: hypothetical protein LC772_10640 [Chloroflexi bacterium]|nr:hypothetical protein [Chloroflexota bacterium]
MLYQHDLALETMSNKPGVLTWNLAYGLMLSYNWEGSGKSWQSVPWSSLITWLQRDVAALYAGQSMTEYTNLSPHVTQTGFPAVRIIANWDAKNAYTAHGTTIAPGGFEATATDGTVVAGAFRGRFNGYPLARGTHYLIVERAASHVIVRQPVGSSTPVSVDLPPGTAARKVRVTAFDQKDRAIGKVRAAIGRGKVRFTYRPTIRRRVVAYYRIANAGT